MESKIKLIKNEQDHKDALALIEDLMSQDPDPESEAGEKLSILTTLVHDYESKMFPESLPDPVDAICFRMEQQHLKPRDLIPYIGSRSKVSEILSRKRPLTLSMIRSLESNLGIPAKVLVKEGDEFRSPNQLSWDNFPLKEIQQRIHLGKGASKPAGIDQYMTDLFHSAGSPALFFGMLRKSNYRSIRPVDRHALAAWSAFVINKADRMRTSHPSNRKTITVEFMHSLAQLSAKDNGPLLAIELLKRNGILVVIEPPFSKTYLDGATLVLEKRPPIVGLTLRHDRLDNFWFTLMHELAHIALHSGDKSHLFYDDLDNPSKNDSREDEADRLASEALIPTSKWENSPARLIPSPIAAQSLAKELGIHVAIVAGRMRYENQRFVYLNNVITQAKVRPLFPSEQWK